MADVFDNINVGDKLTIFVHAGLGIVNGKTVQELVPRTGCVVMRSSHGGWVLNMGVRHGIPGVADRENIVAINGKKS